MAWNVVIAGGGFGGVSTANALARLLPRHSTRITLINDTNFLLYTPLLPAAAAGTLEPRHVVVPLRENLRAGIELVVGSVTGRDAEHRSLKVNVIGDEDREFGYDQLVVALRSVSRTLPIPGLAEFGLGLKSLPEAIALRNRLLQNLERAEVTEDPLVRQAALGFVFVGAGYAGLEAIAELQDFASDVLDLYPRCKNEGRRWILVEARDQVMPEVSKSLAEFASRELMARGIELRTSPTLAEVTATTVRLSDGEIVPARPLVWPAGVKPHPIISQLGLPLTETGRIEVDSSLAVAGEPGVWAIGDGAGVPDPSSKGKRPSPPTAQYAIRQGKVAAHNVAAALGSGKARRFKYKNRGVVVEMGQHKAVAETFGIRWRGMPAFVIARLYHLLTMPRTGRRARLIVDWTVGLIFGRDTAELGQLGHVAKLGEADRIAGIESPVANPSTDQQAR